MAWNCRGMGSTLAVRTLTDEVSTHEPLLVFLAETKAREKRIRGIQAKLNYTQGIVVPSDGRSGGLALLWKEGVGVSFKSCSNAHIDVVVRESPSSPPWRATGFYGQPEAEKRYISWQLLEALRDQCEMPWIVFGDFNEIAYSFEKSGGLERDGKQMANFRDCLDRCGLLDLGFAGQRFTWCNGRQGNQRTKLRLDRMVANDDWMRLYPEASVQHFSMSNSDHCLLVLVLKCKQVRKPMKKRFMFEAMWTREEGCREIIESVWDPLSCDMGSTIMDKLRQCHDHLQCWNWRVFGHVKKVLKQKQSKLQQLEVSEIGNEKSEEIRKISVGMGFDFEVVK
nr:hypothetical protein CFP56_30518 [Quercus suber]